MLNPPRGKFATRRRDVYLRAVSSSREIRAYKLPASSGRQFDQDRESGSRWLTRHGSCQPRKICAPASGDGRKSVVSYENVHVQVRCRRYGRSATIPFKRFRDDSNRLTLAAPFISVLVVDHRRIANLRIANVKMKNARESRDSQLMLREKKMLRGSQVFVGIAIRCAAFA